MMLNSEPHAYSEALERRRILYLLGDAVEKLIRLRAILDRQRAFIQAHNKKSEYAGVVDPLASELDELRVTLTRNSPRIASVLRGEALDEREVAALPGIVSKMNNVILALHEVLILLPRETVEPQVFQMLRDCFRDEWRDSSVILTNALAAYEYRIEDILENLKDLGQHGLKRWRALLRGLTPSGSVLAQAFIDRDNPLAWPVLAHEYGHALDEAQGISRQIVHGDEATTAVPAEGQQGFELKWTSEIFADFVAARVLGPASQVPILLLEMCRPLPRTHDEAPSHPPTVARLELVRGYLKELGVGGHQSFDEIFQLFRFDYERKLSDLDEPERTKRRGLEEVVEGFQGHAKAVAARVNSLKLSKFGDAQAGNAAQLVTKLQSDLPVSSLRSARDDQILVELKRLVDSGAARDNVYKALAAFNEAPATSAEILTSGWLYKLSTFEAPLRECFPARGSETEINLEKYAEYLARTDELLQQSIEHARVHSVIVGHHATF